MNTSKIISLMFIVGAVATMISQIIGKNLLSRINRKWQVFLWVSIFLLHAWLNIGPLNISIEYLAPTVMFFIIVFSAAFNKSQ